jgi:hypothetical protein
VTHYLTAVPLLADATWAEIIKQGGLAAVILLFGLILKYLVDGVFRLNREVVDRDEQIAELRKERDEADAKLARLQESMMHDFLPALLRTSDTGERLEGAVTKMTERAEQLISAFLRQMER